MIKIRSYIKPYLFSLCLILVLLFTQAFAELRLPNAMQSMVNTGIQNHGIDSQAFKALSAKSMDSLLFLANDKQKELITEAFTRVEPSQATETQKKAYPLVKTKPIYVAKKPAKKASYEILKLEVVAMSLAKAKVAPNPMVIAQMETKVDQKLSSMGKTTLDSFLARSIYNENKNLKIDRQATQQHYVFKTGAIMLGFTALSAICAISVGFLASRLSAGLSRDLRLDVFKKVTGFSQSNMDGFSVSTLITRTTNDIQQIQFALVMSLQMVIYAPILGIGAYLNLIETSAGMDWILFVSIAAVLALVLTVFILVLPRFRIMQQLTDKLNGVVSELLSGVLVIRAFNNQEIEQKKFAKANETITKTSLFTSRVMAMSMPVMMFIMNGTMLLILWFGGHQLADGNIQIGSIMAFIQYAIQVIMSFVMMTMVFIFIPRASVSARRIREVLNTKDSIVETENPQPISGQSVQFNHVGFRYPGASDPVLSAIDFTAKPGQMTGIIGSTGSGKSTIVKLLMRFYDVSEGNILLGDTNIASASLHDLHEAIGYVAQKGQLLSGTVRSNLLYANPKASEEDLWEALEIAQAKDFVSQHPDGLDMEISAGGTNVSGGQRQRLSIARALVKKPPVLVFDDSFSALDYKTDAALRKALLAKAREWNTTIIVVAQRIASIMHADQIIVLDEGQMVGKGVHDDLVKNCEVYREIAYSQLEKEVLEDA